MRCERCQAEVEKDEAREIHGQILCEDCAMDTLSPPKTCDPWAVYTAKSLMKGTESGHRLNPIQSKIVSLLEEEGPMEPSGLAERLEIKPADLEREIAALRHMEVIRGELRDQKRYIRLWD